MRGINIIWYGLCIYVCESVCVCVCVCAWVCVSVCVSVCVCVYKHFNLISPFGHQSKWTCIMAHSKHYAMDNTVIQNPKSVAGLMFSSMKENDIVSYHLCTHIYVYWCAYMCMKNSSRRYVNAWNIYREACQKKFQFISYKVVK